MKTIIIFYLIWLLIALIDYMYYAYRNKCKMEIWDIVTIILIITITSPIWYFIGLIYDWRDNWYLSKSK
jgi:hypothetical protein